MESIEINTMNDTNPSIINQITQHDLRFLKENLKLLTTELSVKIEVCSRMIKTFIKKEETVKREK